MEPVDKPDRVNTPGLEPGLPDEGKDFITTVAGPAPEKEEKTYDRRKLTLHEFYRHLSYTGYRHIIFSTGSKKDDHPWHSRIKSKYMIYCNGRAGDHIQFDSGEKVCMYLDKDACCNVMITLDLMGGKGAEPLDRNLLLHPGEMVKFKVEGDFPDICYYQSKTDVFCGGIIVWKDPPGDKFEESADEREDDSQDE